MHHRNLCFGAASKQPNFAAACVCLKPLIARPLTIATFGALPILARRSVFIEVQARIGSQWSLLPWHQWHPSNPAQRQFPALT
jgi:hypothetical protein